MARQRRPSLCKHCGKFGTHSEARCNRNPNGRFYGRTFDQIYANSNQSVSRGNKAPVSAALNTSGFVNSSTSMASTSAFRAPRIPYKRPSSGHKANDYDAGFAAGFAAGLAAALKTNTPTAKNATDNPALRPSVPDLSFHSPAGKPPQHEAAARKWGDFAAFESARTANFKTDEGRRQQKEAFAKAVADEERNPSKRTYTETFYQTASNGSLTGPRRVLNKTKATIVHDGTKTTSASSALPTPPVQVLKIEAQTNQSGTSSAIPPHARAQTCAAITQPRVDPAAASSATSNSHADSVAILNSLGPVSSAVPPHIRARIRAEAARQAQRDQEVRDIVKKKNKDQDLKGE
ncbi:hypothetical protein AC578_1619 [Pseudocercospora eumusae]|uniref:Uncharacterized protein n=1 Tax=Pseudocercospora eumusae TaxID=321146 RepID=A0A139HM78_9PEZI|nr:hypothetical protein AC578_1619 [Pseudocercospora eumusae]